MKDRITQRQKDLHNQKWYKEKIDGLDSRTLKFYTVDSNKAEAQANYDLFNNKINVEDFKHITHPFGKIEGELPADFKNQDIVSGKIKAILGMELKKPLDYKIVATNREATSRREKEEFSRIKEIVISEIMKEVESNIRKQALAQSKGRDLSEEEQVQIEQQIQQEIQNQTPEEVKTYMKREHQDPAEVMMSQIFEYETKRINIKRLFNNGFKHALLAGIEVYYLGIENKRPVVRVLNPLHFEFDRSPDVEFIEDSEWGIYEYRMSPSEVIRIFGEDLSNTEIDEIYALNENRSINEEFSFIENPYGNNNIRVIHAAWKSLKKIGFLTYLENGIPTSLIVDESYKLTPNDISLEWTWIPEVHEGWKIGKDIYKKMGPTEGQFKDIYNLHNCKLPFYGAVYDDTNSTPIALMGRLKPWQYYYDIILYRIQNLMASDKGKMVLINANLIPTSDGMTVEKWLYYMENLKIGFMNPNEEGASRSADITNAAKDVDLSLVSDISKYMQIAEYIELKAGRTVGITPEVEGQIANSAAVSNTQNNLVMASNIIEPYFSFHNYVKANVLEAFVEKAKVAYSSEDAREALTYVLDDMSLQMLSIDKYLLDNSTYGFFVDSSSKAWEIKQVMTQLSQAALQNDKAELSDIISIMEADSLIAAKELLKNAEERAHERELELENTKAKNQQEILKQQEAYAQKNHERMLEQITIKEEERRETELQKQAMLSIGFNEEKDADHDGELDVLELYRKGRETDIKVRKQALEEQKFKHQQEFDKEKLKIENKKANKSKNSN